MAAEVSAIKSELTISIEQMNEHDLLEVCEIEATTDLSAWGWDAYHNELQSGEHSIMLVARVDSAFHGFGVAGFIVARLIAGELHVNNIGVRPQLRARRIGSSLLRTALARAKEKGAAVAHLEVRAGNQAAQRLYQSCGFVVVGRRRKYYRKPSEDALLMSATF